LTGSGRDELAGLLAGQAPRGGQVQINGRPLAPGSPSAATRGGLCCVPGDRALQALLTGATVRENLTISDLEPVVSHFHWLSGRAEKAEAKTWLARLDVQPPAPEKVINELSGGNQQKVVIARWLRVSPRILVLDEPTQGVDVGAKADIHQLVRRSVADGLGVVLCSSDTDELAALSDEVIVLRAGRIGARLRGRQLTTDQIEHEQLISAAPTTVPADIGTEAT
jgi:ribose transport system ATP-binding protein